jgi:hypothetical protein
VEKFGAVATDDDPGACDEAPTVMDGSCRSTDGGRGAAGGKIPAISAWVGPTKVGGFPAAALEVPASDEPIIGVTCFTRAPS